MKLKVLVVIPVYNHSHSLRMVVLRCLKLGYQVLVVDDGSTDEGLEVLRSIPCLKHRLPYNQGKGVAILEGLKIAQAQGYEAVVTLDADGQHYPEDISRLIAEAEKAWPCIVIGAREGMDAESVPQSSRFGRTFSNFWVRLETGIDLPDTQSGFRLYPVDLILALNLKSKRYDFEIEVLVKAIWAGIPVRSVPVRVFYSSKGRTSHFHKIFDNLRLSWLHTKLILRRLLPLPHKKLIKSKTSYNLLTCWLQAFRQPLKLLKSLCREHNSPGLLATSVWLGLFMGALPLIACHTIAIIYVSHRLNLNKVASVAASQFCCPPFVPAACIVLGHLLRHGSLQIELSLKYIMGHLKDLLFDWFLGSLILGPILGFAGALAVYYVAYSYVKARPNRDKKT